MGEEQWIHVIFWIKLFSNNQQWSIKFLISNRYRWSAECEDPKKRIFKPKEILISSNKFVPFHIENFFWYIYIIYMYIYIIYIICIIIYLHKYIYAINIYIYIYMQYIYIYIYTVRHRNSFWAVFQHSESPYVRSYMQKCRTICRKLLIFDLFTKKCLNFFSFWRVYYILFHLL